MAAPKLDSLLRRVQRPARYVDGEWNAVVKDWSAVDATLALCYPDVYEAGMSSLEYQLLYRQANDHDRLLCERAFAPWPDMAAALRQERILQYALESGRPVGDFDLVGFVLAGGMRYATVLESLDLAGLPVSAADRDSSHPLVLGMGARCPNPEPLAPFIDLFLIGEPEAVLPEVLEVYLQMKQPRGKRPDRDAFLARAALVPGVYVPSLYEPSYAADGTVVASTPVCRRVPDVVEYRLLAPLGPPLTGPIVPYLEVLHDRGVVEVQRACGHCQGCDVGGRCEFLRERRTEEVLSAIDEMVRRCGYREIALVAPSPGDLGKLVEVARSVRGAYPPGEISLELPPLLLEFPRDEGGGVIAAAEAAFRSGWSVLRYRYVAGQPGRDPEEFRRVVNVAARTQEIGWRVLGRRPRISVEVTNFSPRPHKASQWSAMPGGEDLRRVQDALRKALRKLGIRAMVTDPGVTWVDAALAMGDRRVSQAIDRAWRLGCAYDGWGRPFDLGRWKEAFRQAGIDPGFYVERPRSDDEVFPWARIVVPWTREPRGPRREAAARRCAAEPCPICRRLEGVARVVKPGAVAGAKGAG